jgi:hypothetical protein
MEPISFSFFSAVLVGCSYLCTVISCVPVVILMFLLSPATFRLYHVLVCFTQSGRIANTYGLRCTQEIA